MSAYDIQLGTVPSNTVEARLAQAEGRIAALLGGGGGYTLGVGDTVYTTDVPSNWNTPGSIIIVKGQLMVPNGVDLSRADFPELNAIYSRQGYPHGAGDGSTTFGTPDILGRLLASVGTNATMDVGDNDGQTLPNRAVEHKTSKSLTISGTPGGTFVTSVGHTDSTYQGGVTASAVLSVSGPTSTPTVGSLGVAGTVGPTGSFPTDMSAYIVAGIDLLIVLP